MQELSSFLPRVIFNGVCWNTYGQRFSIDSLLLNEFNQGAVTLEDVIVFRDDQAASEPALWAHEMIHVRRIPIPRFRNLCPPIYIWLGSVVGRRSIQLPKLRAESPERDSSATLLFCTVGLGSTADYKYRPIYSGGSAGHKPSGVRSKGKLPRVSKSRELMSNSNSSG